MYETSDKYSELNEGCSDSVKVGCRTQDSEVTNFRHVEQVISLLQLENKQADLLRWGMLQTDGGHQEGSGCRTDERTR